MVLEGAAGGAGPQALEGRSPGEGVGAWRVPAPARLRRGAGRQGPGWAGERFPVLTCCYVEQEISLLQDGKCLAFMFFVPE